MHINPQKIISKLYENSINLGTSLKSNKFMEMDEKKWRTISISFLFFILLFRPALAVLECLWAYKGLDNPSYHTSFLEYGHSHLTSGIKAILGVLEVGGLALRTIEGS